MNSYRSPSIDPSDVPDLFHGIRADSAHWHEVWNFSLAGTRTAIASTASVYGLATLGEVPLDDLRQRPEAFPGTFVSGFGATVMQAAMIRAGMNVGIGVPPYETRWYSDEVRDRIIHNADRELIFEQVRRAVAPDASSRLSCIWAVEDTWRGRAWVERMMGVESFTFSARLVTAVRVSRCDARWLDATSDLRQDAARGYWSGDVMGSDPLWEYLIEGVIQARNAEDVQRAKHWAVANYPKPSPPTDQE